MQIFHLSDAKISSLGKVFLAAVTSCSNARSGQSIAGMCFFAQKNFLNFFLHARHIFI